MAGVTFNWGFDLSSDDDEDQQEPAQEEGAAGGWQPGTQEEDPGGQEEDQGQEEPYTPTNARPRLVQRTISLTFGLGEATCESLRVSVSFHNYAQVPSLGTQEQCLIHPNLQVHIPVCVGPSYGCVAQWAQAHPCVSCAAVSRSQRCWYVVGPIRY